MVYLTKRQREILEFIRSFQAAKGYAPSLEEIAAHFKLSAVSTPGARRASETDSP